MGCLMLVFWWLSFWNGVKGEAPMSDNEMKSTEKTDTRTVNIRAEIWHALPEKSLAAKSTRRLRRSAAFTAKSSIHTAFRSVIASAASISPVLQEPGCRSNLETFPG
jgi:hypothetical protein